MRRTLFRIFAIMVVLAGIGLLCYPSFASFINQQFMYTAISDYDAAMADTGEDEIRQILETAQAYNASLPADFPVDPFTGENVRDFTGTEYENFYMLQDGQMLGYVEIPCIDVYLPIYYGTSEEVLLQGAGLVNNTSLPVGGEGTHAVVSAHTGLASNKMFTDLTEMEEGDIFFIHVLDMNLAYQVDQIKVVLPEDTDDLLIQEGKDYVTLLTCTPFGINDHRLLVRGVRIDYDFESEDNTAVSVPLQAKVDTYSWVIIIGAFLIVVLFIAMVSAIRRNRRAKAAKKVRLPETEKPAAAVPPQKAELPETAVPAQTAEPAEKAEPIEDAALSETVILAEASIPPAVVSDSLENELLMEKAFLIVEAAEKAEAEAERTPKTDRKEQPVPAPQENGKARKNAKVQPKHLKT